MASKKKTGALAANIAALLASAVNSTQTGAPFFAAPAVMAPLVSHPNGALVEFNDAAKNPANPSEIAFRATAAGVAFHQSQTAPQSAPQGGAWPAPQGGAPTGGAPAQSSVPTKAFSFQSGIPIPAARRGGKGQNAYGFEQMNVGDSFFIPATDDNPNPSKRVASTVSSASKRLEPKSFIVRSVTEGNPPQGGARVWRTA